MPPKSKSLPKKDPKAAASGAAIPPPPPPCPAMRWTDVLAKTPEEFETFGADLLAKKEQHLTLLALFLKKREEEVTKDQIARQALNESAKKNEALQTALADAKRQEKEAQIELESTQAELAALKKQLKPLRVERIKDADLLSQVRQRVSQQTLKLAELKSELSEDRSLEVSLTEAIRNNQAQIRTLEGEIEILKQALRLIPDQEEEFESESLSPDESTYASAYPFTEAAAASGAAPRPKSEPSISLLEQSQAIGTLIQEILSPDSSIPVYLTGSILDPLIEAPFDAYPTEADEAGDIDFEIPLSEPLSELKLKILSEMLIEHYPGSIRKEIKSVLDKKYQQITLQILLGSKFYSVDINFPIISKDTTPEAYVVQLCRDSMISTKGLFHHIGRSGILSPAIGRSGELEITCDSLSSITRKIPLEKRIPTLAILLKSLALNKASKRPYGPNALSLIRDISEENLKSDNIQKLLSKSLSYVFIHYWEKLSLVRRKVLIKFLSPLLPKIQTDLSATLQQESVLNTIAACTNGDEVFSKHFSEYKILSTLSFTPEPITTTVVYNGTCSGPSQSVSVVTTTRSSLISSYQ